jgi:TolB-like protein
MDSVRLAAAPTAGPGARGRFLRKAFESLAVLPFENTGSDPDAEYFSDGITESIIHSVSELPRIRVMARARSSGTKGRLPIPWRSGGN